VDWKIVFSVCVLLIAQTTHAQSNSGSLSGRVVGPDGAAVADAPIRAVNAATGTDARTYSSASGRYVLQNLPPGKYVVSIAMPCCAFAPYKNEDVAVTVGQALELNLELKEGESLNVLGDDPETIAAELRRRQTIPNLPVPRTSSGRPDLSGVWLVGSDPFPEQPEALPWAEAIARERIANQFRDHPHTRCLPSELPVPGSTPPFMGKFVQTPGLLLILFEDPPGFRQVYLDGRSHPADPNPTWMGHSIGRWDGDTLVVDTLGFNSRGWNDPYPRTEMMRLEERYTRTAYGWMDVRVTITDPGVLTKPWVQRLRFDLVPQEDLVEYVCENNKWAREVQP
jgi:hypothetical protein